MRRIPLVVILACGCSAAPSPAQERPSDRGSAQPVQSERREPDLTLWQWANFIVLAAVIGYYGVKLGKPYFDGQTTAIGKGLDEARARQGDSERRSREVHDKLARLGVEIDNLRQSVIEEQRAEAERRGERLREEIERVHTNAAQQVEHLAKQERLALQRHAAQLALHLAERRLRFIMNNETQDALTGQFVESFESVAR